MSTQRKHHVARKIQSSLKNSEENLVPKIYLEYDKQTNIT